MKPCPQNSVACVRWIFKLYTRRHFENGWRHFNQDGHRKDKTSSTPILCRQKKNLLQKAQETKPIERRFLSKFSAEPPYHYSKTKNTAFQVRFPSKFCNPISLAIFLVCKFLLWCRISLLLWSTVSVRDARLTDLTVFFTWRGKEQ